MMCSVNSSGDTLRIEIIQATDNFQNLAVIKCTDECGMHGHSFDFEATQIRIILPLQEW